MNIELIEQAPGTLPVTQLLYQELDLIGSNPKILVWGLCLPGFIAFVFVSFIDFTIMWLIIWFVGLALANA